MRRTNIAPDPAHARILPVAGEFSRDLNIPLELFNMSYSVGQIHKYSVNLYKSLTEETGQEVGFSVVGNIRLATNQARMDEYHQYAGVAFSRGQIP